VKRALVLAGLLAATQVHAAVPLTLHEAVSKAQDSHPDVLQAQADVGRAEAQLLQAKATALPSANFLAQYTQFDGDRTSGGKVLLPASQAYAALGVTVPVLVPQRWATWRHAEDSAGVAVAVQSEARWQVGVATARLWLSLLAAERQIAVLERSRATAQTHLGFAQERKKGGLGNQLDAVRAAQEVAQADALVKASRVLWARMSEQLGFLAGLDQAVVPCAPPEVRPDVRSLDQRRQSAQRVVADSRADWLPSVYATLTPFMQLPALPTLPNAGLQAQVVLSVPVFEWGGRDALRREREAALLRLDAQRAGLARQIASDERAALAAWQAAEAALQATRELLRSATEGLNLAQMAWKVGVVTNLDVVDAERRERDAATAVVVAEDTVRQAWLETLVARGQLP
jgi:outer membrane protein TolC